MLISGLRNPFFISAVTLPKVNFTLNNTLWDSFTIPIPYAWLLYRNLGLPVIRNNPHGWVFRGAVTGICHHKNNRGNKAGSYSTLSKL